MRFVRATSTTTLFLLFGMIVPAYAQHDKQNEKQGQPAKQQAAPQGAQPQHPQAQQRQPQARAQQPQQRPQAQQHAQPAQQPKQQVQQTHQQPQPKQQPLRATAAGRRLADAPQPGHSLRRSDPSRRV